MLNPTLFENSLPEGFSVLEVVTNRNQTRQFVPLRRTELTGEIVGPLASLKLQQTFSYTKQQCDQILEAHYRFPLPGDAAVMGVTVTFGSKTIRAELQERTRAEANYEAAKAEGKQAALLTRESPDVFTLSVAGITPDEPVQVETHYVQLVRLQGKGYELRVPLTTAPRYVRKDEVEAQSRHVQGQPLALARDPGHRFALTLRWADEITIQDASHRLNPVKAPGGGTSIQLYENEVLPDKDFVVTWRPTAQDYRPTLKLWSGIDGEHGYFLAQLTPPKQFASGSGVAREAILLLDHSGSMQGKKWETADWVVSRFLQDFTLKDRFALGVFHDSTRWIHREPVAATGDVVKKTIAILKSLKDSGTELGVALEQALRFPSTPGHLTRHVLLVTDAEVTDSGRLIRLIEARWGRRISLLCIDAAPNSLLVHELAEQGGGIARFLTSRATEGDLQAAFGEILEDWSEPVAAGLRLELQAASMEASGRLNVSSSAPEWSALDFGDLPHGRSIWVVGRFKPHAGAATLQARAIDGQGNNFAETAAEELSPTLLRSVKALYGARRVLELEYLSTSHCDRDELLSRLARLGYSKADLTGSATPSIYEENEYRELPNTVRAFLVKEALEYGLASSETAFIAVHEDSQRREQGTAVVANALPQDHMDTFGYGADVGEMLESLKPIQKLGAPRAQASGGTDSALIMSAPASPPVSASAAFMIMGLDDSDAWADFADAEEAVESEYNLDDYSDYVVLFSGVPDVSNRTAVLFDSQHPAYLAIATAFFGHKQLDILMVSTTWELEKLTPFTLLLYVDDMTTPVQSVSLYTLLRQGGALQLNQTIDPMNPHIRLVLHTTGPQWNKRVALNVRVTPGNR